MKITIIFLFILLLPTLTNADEQKVCHEFIDDCSFYACIENEVSCGKKGYPISFGKRYCLKFEKKLHKFSPQAQKWMHDTQSCLTQKLFDNYEELTCKKLKKQAFKDHLDCYYDSGYCELPGKDKRTVVKIAKRSLLKWRVIKTGIQLLFKCAKKRF